MAAQDILSLGINVDSFDEQKRTVLNDYISLFNQLSKYDGKVFNPVLGGGLLDLSTSIKETNVLLDQLNAKLTSVAQPMSIVGTSSALASSEMQKLTATLTIQEKQIAALKLQLSDLSKTIISGKPLTDASTQSLISNGAAAKSLTTDYLILKAAVKEQGLAYSNAYLQKGPNSLEAKENLSTYTATAGVVNDINNNLKGSHSALSIVGKDLSTYYNRLRIIAYILPGIGVAGIFSLAFEAIEKAAEALDLFNDKSTKLIDLGTKENEQLSSKIQLYENLLKLEKDYHEAFEFEFSANKPVNTVQQQAQKIAADKAYGTNADIISEEELRNAQDKLNQASFNAGIKPGERSKPEDIINAIKQESSSNLQILRSEADKVAALKDDLNKTLREKTFLGIGIDGDIKLAESKLKEEESIFTYFNNAYNSSLGKLKDYYDSKKDLDEKAMADAKLKADEQRKLVLDNATTEISISEGRNKKIENDERSTEQQRISVLNRILVLKRQQNQADFLNIETNNSSTNTEISIASNKKYLGDKTAELDNIIKVNALIESYRQKRLTAQEDIDKSTLNEVVNSNEKVYQNEQKSIYDRLTAYSAYIVNKQKIDDVEYKRNIDVLSLKTGDKTAQLQIEALSKHREEQKLSDQAGVEKEVYNIVYGGEHKQLDLIKEVNQGRYEDTKSQHAKEITELTESLNKKEISYRNYYRKIEKLQKDLTSKDLKSDINVDKENIFDLEEKGSSLAKQGAEAKSNVQDAKDHLGYAKQEGLDTLPYQKEYDVAVGNEEAISKAIIDIDTATSIAKRKLGDDELRLALLNIEKRKKAEEELNKVITEIGNKVLDGAKEQIDAGYQYQENVVEKKKGLVDEGLESELNAISISTLSNKDKATLDIQLNEQKRENDKNADLEERRLKRSQAEADRAFAVAKIVWNTEQAISKTYADFGSLPIAFPLAIAQGVLGAVEIATVLATPIPAFKEGVRGFSGGLARTGEDGVEEIREPYKSPYLVYKDTVSYLPAGTDVIPVDDMAVPEERIDTGWDQTRWLAKQMKKNNREIKNVFRPVINIDLGFENHKRKMLGI